MEMKDIRKLNSEALALELAASRGKLFKLRTQAVSEKVEDNSQFRKIRRDIARMLTEQTSRAKTVR